MEQLAWWGAGVAVTALVASGWWFSLVQASFSYALSLMLSPWFEQGADLPTIRCSVWQGLLQVQQLKLKASIVDAADLPFMCTSACVKDVLIAWPWWRGPAMSVTVSGLALRGKTRSMPQAVPQDVAATAQQKAAKAITAAKLKAVDGILWGHKETWRRGGGLKSFAAGHLAYLLIRQFQLLIEDFSVNVELDQAVDSPAEVYGAAASESDALGSSMVLRLHGFSVHNRTAGSYGALSTTVQLKGFNLDVIPAPVRGLQGTTASVIKRWNVSVQMSWTVASKLWDRLAPNHGSAAKVPVLNVDISAAALLVHLDASSLKSLLGLAASMLHFFQYREYRRLRPQVAVSTAPQSWWQHAVHAVLREREHLQGSDHAQMACVARRHLRIEYCKVYKRHIRSTSWFGRVLGVLLLRQGVGKQLLQLENRLSDGEVAQFRWWTWATWYKRCRAPKSEALAGRLSAVYGIMAAQDIIKQRQSHTAHKSQVGLYCPKIAIMFEGWATDSKPAQFEVAAQELSAKLQSGVHTNRHSQTSPGPVSLQASCRALLVTHSHLQHDTAAIRLNLGALAGPLVAPPSTVSYDQATLEKLTPWIVTSPPRPAHGPYQAPSQPSLFQHQSDQPFVAFSFKRPARKAQEPTVLQLTVAPIDVIYSQLCLLSLLDFLNAAWPAAGLDPLKVRASVSLREIVQEKLLGQQQRQMARRQQQHNMQRTKVQIGHVRLMLPCGESQSVGSQEEAASPPGAASMERSNSAFASVDMDAGQQAPNMLVIVLAGFQATSRTTEARVSNYASPGVLPASPAETTPEHVSAAPPAAPAAAPVAAAADVDKIKAEHMRSSSAMPALGPLQLGTKSSLLPSAAADAARLAGDAAAAALLRSQTIAAPGAQGQGPATAPSLDVKDKPGVLGRAHTVAAIDQSKLQTAAGSSLQAAGESASGVATPAARSDSSAWKKQRPGATFFEKLQMHVEVQAFLTLPDLTAEGAELDDYCQVIKPFSIETAVDHCVEPTSTGNYRRVVQVHLSTSDVDIELSQYVKRELHSLHNYLLMSFTSQDIADFSKHFAKEGKASPKGRGTVGSTLHHANSLTEGVRSTLRRNAGSHPDLVHSDGSGVLQPEPAEPADKTVQGKAGYGLVLALQLTVPCTRLTLVQSLSAEYPDHPRQMFRLEVSDIQTAVALEDSEQDIRFAIGACSLQDLAQEANVKAILAPTPKSVDRNRSCRRAYLQRFFEVWRAHTAQHASKSRRACNFPQHLLITSSAQFSGHIIVAKQDVIATVHGSFLCASLEIGMLRRALMYLCELRQAKPRATASHHAIRADPSLPLQHRPHPYAAESTSGAAGADLSQKAAGKVFGATTASPWSGRTSGDKTAVAKPVHTTAAKPKRNLTMQVFLHCARIDLVMEEQRFATVMWGGFDFIADAGGSDPARREWLMECSGLQIIDRLCASVHYRQAVSCEGSGASMASTPSSDCLLRIAMTHKKVVHLPASPHQAASAAAAGEPNEATPSMAQDTTNAHMRSTMGATSARSPRRRIKAVPLAQTVFKVEADSLHLTLVGRFVYDVMHFVTEAREIASVLSTPSPAALPDTLQQPADSYRPITEVVLTNLRVDVPRCSWSPEMYTLSCAQARLLLPVAEEQVANMMPDMSRAPRPSEQARADFSPPSGGQEWFQMVMQSMMRQYHRDFVHRVRSDRFSPCVTAVPHRRRTSEHVQAFDHEAEFYRQFNHSWTCSWAMAAELTALKTYWASSLTGMHDLAMRQVIDGADALVSIGSNPTKVQVWWPWASAVWGEVQFELMMAILWENMAEPCSFGPQRPPPFPIGKPLPPQPPAPETLGVDKSKTPQWEVVVNVHSISLIMEKLPPFGYEALGSGPDLGTVKMRDLLVKVGRYPCGSLDVEVSSSGLAIADKRHVPHMPRHLSIITITPDQPDDAGSTSDVFAPWDTVRGFMATNVFMPEFSRLAHRSSFERRHFIRRATSTVTSVLSHRRSSQDRRSSDDKHDRTGSVPRVASRLGSVLLDDPESPRAQQYNEQEEDEQLMEFEHGFSLEYVIQIVRPGQGPHVMEVHLKGAQLQWPYVTQMDFVWDLANAYKHYFIRDWVAPYPEDMGPNNWFYINVMLDNSELFVPLPDQLDGEVEHALNSKLRGVALRWEQLRVGYFFGGDGEKILRLNAHELSMVGRLPEVVQSQDWLVPVRAVMDSALVDDRYGHPIEVMAVRLQDVHVHVQRELTMLDQPMSTVGDVAMGLEVTFLNSAVDSVEPMVEGWPFTVAYRHNGNVQNLSFQSNERLNLVVTPAAFRSLGDLRSFLQLLNSVPDPVCMLGSRTVTRCFTQNWLGPSRAKMSTLYRLVNRSGLRLSYWTDDVGEDGEVGCAYTLNAWEESPLLVDPVERTVIIPDTQQQVLARTICMQFEGNWTPVTDIVVDKVGKYAYVIGSPHDAAATPVVMDVVLDVRTKVLTVHSPFRVENLTNQQLEFNVHLFRGPQTPGAPGKGAAAISVVPNNPLAPGQQTYLPVPAIWGGLMYVHVIGWETAKKDKIDLEGSKLKEKQGLYTCPPSSPNQLPFHCCLEVKEEQIKVATKEGEPATKQDEGLPEYVLRFHAPIVMHNLLPYPVTVTLTDSRSSKSGGVSAQVGSWNIRVGGSEDVYFFDLSKKLKMGIEMQEYRSVKDKTIHHPHASWATDEHHSIFGLPDWSLLGGFSSSSNIMLKREGDSDESGISHHGNQLLVCIHNKMDFASKAREVVIFCPYWIVNKTNLTLKLKDNTPVSSLPPKAAPGLGGFAQPILFGAGRAHMRISVHESYWSKTINLESVGINTQTHTYAPTNSVGRASRMDMDVMMEDVIKFENQFPIEPGAQVPGRKRNSSRMLLAQPSSPRSKKFKGPSGLPIASPVMDPGHLLTKLNADITQKHRHEFSLETCLGPTIFHRTKVITITSRYVLFNNSSEPLQYGQRNTSLVWQLAPGIKAPFHWDDADGRFELCVRPAQGKWIWSGAFEIDQVDDFGLRVYNTVKRHRILPVDISLSSGSLLITVGKDAQQPPYRIENRCEHVTVKFQQRDLETANDWDTLTPGNTAEYAWDEPMAAHRLRVVLESATEAFRDAPVQEYNLDDIKAYPKVRLGRAHSKMVQRVANVGRVIKDMSGMGNRTQSMLHVDQPELDARFVYVGVHADGPTRVLCFSETKDQYTRGSNEESMSLLTSKLARLEERIKDVDGKLKDFQEKQNIDIGLIMGRGNNNASLVSDKMQVLPRANIMRMGATRSLSVSTLRPRGRQTDSAGEQAGTSAAPAGTGWQAPPIVFRGADDTETPSTPTRVKQLLKRGVVKFKEAAVSALPVAQPFTMGTSSPTQEPLLHVGTTSRRKSLARLGPPLPRRRSSDENADTKSVSEFEWDASSRADMSIVSRAASSRSRRSSVSITEHAMPQMIADVEPLSGLRRFPSLPLGSSWERHNLALQANNTFPKQTSGQQDLMSFAGDPSSSANLAAMSQMSPASFSNLDLGEGAVLHDNPLGGTWHNNPLVGSVMSTPRDSPRPPRLLLPGEATTEVVPVPLVRGSSNLLLDHSLPGSGADDWFPTVTGAHRQMKTIGTTAELEQRPDSIQLFSPSSETAVTSDPILGGELVIRVVDAQGLMDTWLSRESKSVESSHTSRAALNKLNSIKARLRNARSEVYCTLQCENQVKRTSVAMGQAHPVWKEEVTFKSVQITSDLQVSVYGRSRLSQDVFLGEVLIPLREVEEAGATGVAEVHKYILGRRSTKERVSGEIALACSWRVTPLDVVIMKVRTKQEEVDHKEEVLAVLLERQGSMTSPSKVSLAGPDPKAAASHQTAGDVKRLGSSRGRLDVKVIEARNLAVPSDLLHTFYTMDSYSVVSCTSEAGVTNHHTKIERNNLQPHWNERCTFEDVALSNNLTVAIFDHKKLSSDIFLGQVGVPVMRLHEGKPHYTWLPLQKRTDRDNVSGEVHLRMQWISQELDSPADAALNLVVDVLLHGIGLSVVESSVKALPREVFHALFENIHVDYKYSPANQSARFAVYSVQIDNQLLSSTHPVVLCHSSSGVAAAPKASVEEGEGVPQQTLGKPFVEVQWEMLHHNPSILYFRALLLQIQELDLTVEEEFLDLLLKLVRELPMADIYQMDAQPTSQPMHSSQATQTALQDMFAASVETPTSSNPRRGRKWYFERLEVQTIKCNVTLIPRPGSRDVESGLSPGRIRMAATLGVNFIDINNVPLKINALAFQNALLTPGTLMSHITRHLINSALHEMHKILSQVEILGSPIMLGSSIISGLSTFLAEPAKARNPSEFARGVGTGSVTLIKMASFGILTFIGQLTGGISKGMAMLTLDQDYISRFRNQPMTAQQRLIYALQALGVGMYEGVIGVVRDPLVGYQAGGAAGLALGVIIGGTGLVLKPTSGLLECISKGVNGLGMGILAWGDEVVRIPRTRIRSPRHFGMFAADPTGEVRNFSRWKNTLAHMDRGRYAGDTVLDYLQNKDTKALVFTDKHLVYLNLKRQRLRWAFAVADLSTVTTHGLNVHLHHNATVHLKAPRTQYAYDLQVPLRKMVECRTRDLHQSLLVKLNRALATQGKSGGMTLEGARSLRPFPHHPALEGTEDLRIMHQQPPRAHQDADAVESESGSPSKPGLLDALRYSKAGSMIGRPPHSAAAPQGFENKAPARSPLSLTHEAPQLAARQEGSLIAAAAPSLQIERHGLSVRLTIVQKHQL
ncbi:hypothetical protein WJX79_011021 [Trebouxia sp. C0005]